VWHAGFIWDDDSFVTNNPVIKGGDGLYRLWFTAATPDYYPMTFSMLWVEWRVWADNPLGYHLVNVLLHAFSAILLWRALLRLRIPGALLAAGLFALHPVNVESVAWISEGKNTLCMVFYLGGILAWLEFEDSGARRWYGLALGAFVLALFSKTAVAPLPLVLLGIAWWRRGRVEWKDVRQVVPFFVIAGAVCWVTMWFHYHRAIGQEVIRTDGFWSRLAGAGWAVWFYLYKAVLPLNLVFVYPRWKIDARSVLSYIPLILFAAALVLCWRHRRGRGKALFIGLAYFVAMLLPILGFLNVYYMRYSLVADHWQYFAVIGPIALAAAAMETQLGRMARGKHLLQLTTGAALLAALGTLTWLQCGMYAEVETLWLATLARNPDSWLAHNNLGLIWLEAGDRDEAIPHFQRAAAIDPGRAEAYLNLGMAFAQKGKMDEAIAEYQKALAIAPRMDQTHVNLGVALMQKGELDEAIAEYQRALAISPGVRGAHNNLGIAFAKKGQLTEAVAQFQKALEMDSDDEGARKNLALALDRLSLTPPP
jgi:Flp pilus assembly protein TadD